MELKQLRCVTALAEELHFERASGRVGLEQGAFSRKIRQLERELGVKLFERTNQGTQGLTAAGVAFLPWARVLVVKWEQAELAIREAAAGMSDQLRVGICDDVPIRQLSSVLEKFRARQPKVDIQLIERPCSTLIQDLQTDILDVGFSLLGAPGHDAILARPLWTDDAYIAVLTAHELANRDSVTLQDISSERLILSHRQCECGRREVVDQLIREANGHARVKEATSFVALQAYITSGYGVGIVSGAHIERLRQAGLVVRPLRERAAAFRSFVLYRRGNESDLVTRFVDVARSSLGK